MSGQDVSNAIIIKDLEDKIIKLEDLAVANSKLINNNKKVLIALLHSTAIKFLNQWAEEQEQYK
jgi:hypothetical protein